jgi:hypothetical protein
VVERRYLQNVKYAKNAAADAERQKLAAVVALFKKYGAQVRTQNGEALVVDAPLCGRTPPGQPDRRPW